MNFKYHLTFDIDWAPDSSIELCLDILAKKNIKATFFATHQADMNKEILLCGHELGIHPNFLERSDHGNSTKEIIETCLEFAPNAKFVRTHALVQSTPLLIEIFGNYKELKADVSLFMHRNNSAHKCDFVFQDILFQRILYNWEDDVEFYNKSFVYNKPIFFGETTIFNFHPIHVHLNSSNESEYNKLKEFIDQPLRKLKDKTVKNFSNKGLGTKDFLNTIINTSEKSILLGDI